MIDPTYSVTVGQAKEFLSTTLKAIADAQKPDDPGDNRGTIIASLQHLLKDIPDETPVYEIRRMLDKCGVQWG